MVHEGPDNLANIPERYQSSASTTPGPDSATLETGDSGARVACGVLRRR
jgi:Cu-Zn family superoxide dismutase